MLRFVIRVGGNDIHACHRIGFGKKLRGLESGMIKLKGRKQLRRGKVRRECKGKSESGSKLCTKGTRTEHPYGNICSDSRNGSYFPLLVCRSEVLQQFNHIVRKCIHIAV